MFGFFEKKEAHVDEVKAPAFVEWKGWRKFKVMNRKQECVDTTTFTLMPATLRHACMDAESDVYLCGSEIFVEYVRNIILQYRTIPADHIHTQVFVRTR